MSGLSNGAVDYIRIAGYYGAVIIIGCVLEAGLLVGYPRIKDAVDTALQQIENVGVSELGRITDIIRHYSGGAFSDQVGIGNEGADNTPAEPAE